MFEKYCVMYSCIISTYLFIQMAAYCTPSEDTLGEAPPPSYVVQIGGLWFLESSLQRFKTTTLMTLITHPNTALVFLPSSPLFTNTWLGKRGEEGRKTKAVLGCVINVIKVVVLNR